MYRTVVVGADDSSTARQAVVVAADVAQAGGGQLHIATAYDPKSVRIPDLPDELRYSTTVDPADVQLERLAALVREHGLEPIAHAVSGDRAAAVVRIAEQVGADLVVVGNKGMPGVRRVLGSVPNTIARTAPCSALIADTIG